MAEDNNYGVAGTSLSDLLYGSLNLSQEQLNQAKEFVTSFQPQPEPVDKNLAMLLYFSKMAEEASKPGATLLGSAATALQSPTAYLLQKREEERKAGQPAIGDVLQVAKLMAKPKGQKFPQRTLFKDGGKVVVFSAEEEQEAKEEGYSRVEPAKEETFKERILYRLNPAGDAYEEIKVFSQEEMNEKIKDNFTVIKPAISKAKETKFAKRIVFKMDSGTKKKLTVYNKEDYDEAIKSGYKDEEDIVPKESELRVGSGGDRATYMTKDDAKKYLKNKGLSEQNANFNSLVEKLTAFDKLSVGQALVIGGSYVDLVPVFRGGEIVDFQLQPSTAGQPLFTVSRKNRLKEVAKAQDQFASKAYEVIPAVERAMNLLFLGQYKTGKVSESLQPFRQFFIELFGADNAEIVGIESLQSISNYLAPKMRPIGSGSTSDMEFKAYQQAILAISNTPEANYISLYAFKKMTENGIKLNRLENELLSDDRIANQKQLNQILYKQDTGLFEKYTGEITEENVNKWYDSLPDGAVILNNGIFEIDSPYIIKGWKGR